MERHQFLYWIHLYIKRSPQRNVRRYVTRVSFESGLIFGDVFVLVFPPVSLGMTS